MRTFKDSTGREWQVVINTNAIKRAKDTAGVNLVEIADADAGSRLYGRMLLDPVLVVDIAYGVCKPETDTRKFSREDFNAVLVGDAIAEARQAILEDLVDFFPNPVRDTLKRCLARAADRRLSGPGDSSGTSPESSASIQGT
jgi:hypothetical protein